ncbi:YesL family protein [Lederbergia sp. NSJ-179]|uniref:YesL family protein n=1 Tax=Lederbergia sp. NSJ-179 TaxID=2931402 RepID=UPI001FD5557B|nr:YesL family protein [Lederbergia sp. NSJ-179]MCJ7842235.1 YesL family protein [Lederbergia sp. NSJ-179]
MKLFQIASEWLLRLIWTNLLWIGFTLLGLGILGFMPATVAMFTVLRKWTMKEFDTPIWPLFTSTYFKEWKKSNKIGVIFALIGLFLFLDLSFSEQMKGFFSLFLYVFFLFLFLIYFLTLAFFFPLYVQYTFTIKEYIKQSLIHAIASIKDIIILLLGLIFIGYLLTKIPGLIPFLGVVLPSYWIMTICMKRFRKLEKQQQTIKE